MKINSAIDAISILRPLIDRWEQEECFIITLNTANEVSTVRLIGIGTESSVLFPTKIICRQAILDLASGVIVAHTHPSGNVTPGTADIKETEGLKKMLDVFHIALTDHIIIGKEQSYSFDLQTTLKK